MSGTVLITGAARRIGRELACAFAKDGWRVIVHYRRSKAEAEALAAQLGGVAVHGELSSAAAGEALFGELESQHLLPECLINNASEYGRENLREVSPERMETLLAVNFTAPLSLMQAFARHCGKGHIINLLDQSIAYPDKRRGVYALAKKALWHATEAAALEWAPDIRVNDVAPGLVCSPPGVDPAKIANVLQQSPLGRRNTEGEIAQACLYLAHAPSVTGQILHVDGGMHLGIGN